MPALTPEEIPTIISSGSWLFAVAGLVAMFIVSKIDYQRFRWMSVLALGVSVILLLLVFTPLGRSGGGARRWIQIGGALSAFRGG